MKTYNYARAAVGLLVLSAANLAQAQVDSRTIAFQLRAEPANRASTITHTIELQVVPYEEVEGVVGYVITEVQISRLTPDGAPEAAWTEINPLVDTPDGLWWVEHQDVAYPHTAEFRTPPPIIGVAAAQTGGVDDLIYNLEGVPSDPTPESPYGLETAQLNHVLQETSASEPESEGEDEPAEVKKDDGTV